MSATDRAPRGQTARIAVRVAPGARRSELVGPHGEAWRVRVAAPPERGKANDALLDLLTELLELPRTQLAVVAGHASRDKVIEIQGLTAGEAAQRLRAASGKGK